MFNRTLQRPMFRRGGRAGGGIMTGVQRPGYANDDNQVVEKSDMEKVQGNMESFNKAFPQYFSTARWYAYTSNNRYSCSSCSTTTSKN